MDVEQVQIKLEFEGALRRASVTRNETLAGLKRTVCDLLGVDSCDLTYLDEEGDVITVGSDLELRQLLAAAIKDKRLLRFTVKAKPSSGEAKQQQPQQEEQEEEEAPKEPEFPFANLARALSEPETVQRIQTVAQSPVITEAITRFARAYVESGGDAALAGLLAAQSLPALLGVLAELVNELPVLKDLQELIMQQFARGAPAFVPFASAVPPQAPGACGANPWAGPWGGRGGFRGWGHHHRGGHHGGPHHGPHHGHHPGHEGHHERPCGGGQGHFGVYCDGCTSDEALKIVSIREGHMTHRGFIRGNRYKSHSVHDFDLCESCKNNVERFPESAYGPFTTLAPPAAAEGRGQKRCWGWQRGNCNSEQPWRQQAGQQQHDAERKQGDSVPEAAEAQHPQFDLFDTIKEVIKKGSQAFADAQNQGELSEIARAIAESLRDTPAQDVKPQGAAKAADVKVAEPVAEEPKAAEVATKKQEEDPFVKWAQQLSQLQTLGFDRLETYIDFLEEEKGDLERVVNRIVRRDM